MNNNGYIEWSINLIMIASIGFLILLILGVLVINHSKSIDPKYNTTNNITYNVSKSPNYDLRFNVTQSFVSNDSMINVSDDIVVTNGGVFNLSQCREVVCDCAKNTSMPCMMMCFNCGSD